MPTKAKCHILPWPPPWKRNKPHRKLGWAARKMILFEDGSRAYYASKKELEDALFEHQAYVLMPDYEFNKWVRDYVEAGDQCIYADAAQKIVGFRVKRGRCTRYVYNAKSAWPGMDKLGAGGLSRLRRFLDEWELGDLATPGALGIAMMEALMPDEEKFWRPPWQAWMDLHEHGVAGWVDLFMQYQGDSAVLVDMNSAYPAAARQGMPCGRCTRIYCEADAQEEAWTFGRYEWRLSSDAGVVNEQRFTVLALTNRSHAGDTGGGTVEPGARGEGWYTRVEVEAARQSGAFDSFELRGGWGWERISSAFTVWTERIDDAKARFKALGEDYAVELEWVKRMSVAPFGRFFMNAMETHVYKPGEVEAEGYGMVQRYGRQEVEIQLVKVPCRATDPTKLPQLAVHVWTVTRMQLAGVMELAHSAGWSIFMCAIDGIYARPVGRSPVRLNLDYGLRAGQWKQRDLFEVNVMGPGMVTGQNESGQRFTRMPGTPRGDVRRLGA